MPRKRVGELLRLNFTIPLWIAIFFAVVALLGVYSMAPAQREHIKFVAAVLAGAAGIYSAYYIGAALRTGTERARQDASFRLMEQIDKAEFVQVRNFLEKEVAGHEGLSSIDLYKKISANSQLDHAVTLVLNTFEKVAVGIQCGVLDEDILYLYLGGMVARNYTALRGYIEQLRKDKNYPDYFCELEKLTESWQKGQKFADNAAFAPFG